MAIWQILLPYSVWPHCPRLDHFGLDQTSDPGLFVGLYAGVMMLTGPARSRANAINERTSRPSANR